MLNGMGSRRVFKIESGGTAELIGLNITGGYASVCLPFAVGLGSIAPLERYARALAFLCSILAAGSTSTLAARPTSMAAMCTAMKLRSALALRPFPDLSSSAPLERYT